MAKIISIITNSQFKDWKKAIDGSDDTYWTVFKGTRIEITCESACSVLSFDFQKGFQPTSIVLNGKETEIEKNCSVIELTMDSTVHMEVDFENSYDPYGRIFIYKISAQ